MKTTIEKDSFSDKIWNIYIDGKYQYSVHKEQPLVDGITILVYILYYDYRLNKKSTVLYSGPVKEGIDWWTKILSDPDILIMELAI